VVVTTTVGTKIRDIGTEEPLALTNLAIFARTGNGEHAIAMENLVAMEDVIVAIGYTQAADMVVQDVEVVLLMNTKLTNAAIIRIQNVHAVQVVLLVITLADNAAILRILSAHAVQAVLLVIT